MTEVQKKPGRTQDMTRGPILKQLLFFSIPLLLGNVFQLLYNLVDSIVVGNYVGKGALAAVGATTTIINIQVYLISGFSVGAGVVIGQRFGAKDEEKLHTAVQTTMALTFAFGILITVLGMIFVKPLLRVMSTPADVFNNAALYLYIYYAGVTGLFIYNMGSGILRAVGNTVLPLLFLIFTSVLNIFLDLFFVLGLHMAIEGVACATILSQFVSAILTLRLLLRTKEIYRMTWKDLRIDPEVTKLIFAVALPICFQYIITAISNIVVQGYINHFGSDCIAGWNCYLKLDEIVLLVTQSIAMAATAFVSQNIGAKQVKRADRGTLAAIALALSTILLTGLVLVLNAERAVGLFTGDRAVISYGAMFIQTNTFFIAFNGVNHVLAGDLRGRGNSRGPMAVMLIGYVGARQTYLFLMTHFVSNTPQAVGFGYPVGWMMTMVLMVCYYMNVRKKNYAFNAADAGGAN